MRYPVTYCKSVLIKCQFYIVNFTNKSRLTLFFGQKEKKKHKKERDLYHNLGHNQQSTVIRFVQGEEENNVVFECPLFSQSKYPHSMLFQTTI